MHACMQDSVMEQSNIMLLKMLEKGRMTFQDIVDSRVFGSNRNKVSLERDCLVSKGLVKKSSSKRGQSQWHSLTEKGRKHIFVQSIEEIKESLRIIRSLSESILKSTKHPHYKFIEQAEKTRTADIKLITGKPLESDEKRELAKEDKMIEDLFMIYGSVFEILRQIYPDPPRGNRKVSHILNIDLWPLHVTIAKELKNTCM
jgi:hypothetical protein